MKMGLAGRGAVGTLVVRVPTIPANRAAFGYTRTLKNEEVCGLAYI